MDVSTRIHTHQDPIKQSIGPSDQLRDCYVSQLDGEIVDDHVRLQMALIRIPIVDADFLITLNRPTNVHLFAGILESFKLCDWGLFI